MRAIFQGKVAEAWS